MKVLELNLHLNEIYGDCIYFKIFQIQTLPTRISNPLFQISISDQRFQITIANLLTTIHDEIEIILHATQSVAIRVRLI